MQEMGLAQQSLDKLTRPYFCVPGNHDVTPGSENIYANYEQAFGDRQWEKDNLARWMFLGLDTCEGTASDVTVSPDRIEWLQQQLKKIGKDRPIALATHHPFNPSTKAYRVRNAEELLGLFAGHNLKLVMSGHFHGNQVEERDGVLFTTTACCSSTRDNHDGTAEKGFRLFHVDAESITHEFVVTAG
ncbi:MAG: metallophosphoesterase [Candidatus Hydrogenedentes bacterium]|nr:metallophosphoesterase [Candidatus Hydrogenedentota bacterium]